MPLARAAAKQVGEGLKSELLAETNEFNSTSGLLFVSKFSFRTIRMAVSIDLWKLFPENDPSQLRSSPQPLKLDFAPSPNQYRAGADGFRWEQKRKAAFSLSLHVGLGQVQADPEEE